MIEEIGMHATKRERERAARCSISCDEQPRDLPRISIGFTPMKRETCLLR